jgi:hypothetical protein
MCHLGSVLRYGFGLAGFDQMVTYFRTIHDLLPEKLVCPEQSCGTLSYTCFQLVMCSLKGLFPSLSFRDVSGHTYKADPLAFIAKEGGEVNVERLPRPFPKDFYLTVLLFVICLNQSSKA